MNKLVQTAMVLSSLSLIVAGAAAWAASPRIEVGTVEWRRDLDGAIKKSQRTGKPVFAFFQEVPGCAGCQEFGSTVMSYPPIVEAVEHEFLPVLIYNNRKGKDAKILERYEEPAWNYQVIHFLDGDGKDLIPRKDKVWTREALSLRMIEALEAYESDLEKQETVAFAQSCFWAGEVALGQVTGVIATEAGWIDGKEVTLVRYRPDLVPLETLIAQAERAGVSDEIYRSPDDAYRRADEADQKRQISDSVFSRIELSEMQRTKINAWATVDMQQALAWLTPAQLEQFQRSSPSVQK